jgi:glycosyltransferase involved in cell wall biosynthesis
MQIAILVATKDRPEKLDKLLHSLSNSQKYIQQVIIVSSGSDISSIVTRYRNKLNLKHIHSQISGQIYQKSIGIQEVEMGINWVLFLDDDVTVPSNSIEILVNEYLTVTKFTNVFAFGLKIEGIRHRKYSKFLKLILLLFGLHSRQKGKVLSSGHPQNYQDSLTDIEIQWANGISVWRIEALQFYGLVNGKLSYAAYEDVIFSYRVSRKNPILFASKVIVISQDTDEIKPITLDQFKSASYMRYYFVSKNQNLSLIKLLTSQLPRSIQFTLLGDKNLSSVTRFAHSLHIWIDLLRAIMFKTDPSHLLNIKF